MLVILCMQYVLTMTNVFLNVYSWRVTHVMQKPNNTCKGAQINFPTSSTLHILILVLCGYAECMRKYRSHGYIRYGFEFTSIVGSLVISTISNIMDVSLNYVILCNAILLWNYDDYIQICSYYHYNQYKHKKGDAFKLMSNTTECTWLFRLYSWSVHSPYVREVSQSRQYSMPFVSKTENRIHSMSIFERVRKMFETYCMHFKRFC